jgi:two-component system, chemotaxis family, chemotaxis protein CheY
MPKTILVVEDTVDTRELLHLYLTNEDFIVITSADGGEGLYRAKSDHPDLIITDINMPNLSGLDMIKQLREEPETATTPVIALTAYGKDFSEQAISAGANETMQKPFEFEALVEMVKSLLKQS